MQKIIVKSVQEKHSKDGSKTFYVVTDSKGAELSSFAAEVMAFQPGTVIEAEIEISGKYTNLKEFKVVSNPTAETKAEATATNNGYGQDSPEKRRSIERQTALTLAVDWTKFTIDKTGKAWSGDPLTCANTFYQWISAGTIPPDKPLSTPDKQQPVARKAEPASVSPVTPESVYLNIKKLLDKGTWNVDDMKEAFKDVGALGTTATEKLKSLSEANLMVVSARVNKALFVAKAIQMGAEVIPPEELPFP